MIYFLDLVRTLATAFCTICSLIYLHIIEMKMMVYKIDFKIENRQ